jgi:O-antigen ligase
MFGGVTFFFIHVLSILITSEKIFDVQSQSEFSFIFDILIYQSLVVYPAVISVMLVLIFSFTYSSIHDRSMASKFSRAILAFSPLVFVYLLSASGRRAAILELLCFSILIFVYIGYNLIFKIRVSKRLLTFSLYFLFFFLSFLSVYVSTDLSQRFFKSIDKGTFDSGRLDILASAFSFFYNNFSSLLWGAGSDQSPSFHNFFLDQLYRVGLFGFFMIYLATIMIFFRFISKNASIKSYRGGRAVFLLGIFSCALWQSVVNSSVSQPYYMINILMCFMFVGFTVFRKSDILF